MNCLVFPKKGPNIGPTLDSTNALDWLRRVAIRCLFLCFGGSQLLQGAVDPTIDGFGGDFDLIFFAWSKCKNKAKAKQGMSSNVGPKRCLRKVIFLGFFGVWFRRCARVVPSILFGASGWSQR